MCIQIMKIWWEENEMKIKEQKSGILRILKKMGKIGRIENALNLREVESYKYLGVQINQSIRTYTHHKYIKQKVEGLKEESIY